MRWMLGLLIGFGMVGCGGQGGTYCQSGPKYGTQCYSLADVQSPPGQPPPPAGQPKDAPPWRR